MDDGSWGGFPKQTNGNGKEKDDEDDLDRELFDNKIIEERLYPPVFDERTNSPLMIRLEDNNKSHNIQVIEPSDM